MHPKGGEWGWQSGFCLAGFHLEDFCFPAFRLWVLSFPRRDEGLRGHSQEWGTKAGQRNLPNPGLLAMLQRGPGARRGGGEGGVEVGLRRRRAGVQPLETHVPSPGLNTLVQQGGGESWAKWFLSPSPCFRSASLKAELEKRSPCETGLLRKCPLEKLERGLGQ